MSWLQLACAEGRLDTVSLLVSLGGDLNEGSGTALRLATVNNDLRMAAFLLGGSAAVLEPSRAVLPEPWTRRACLLPLPAPLTWQVLVSRVCRLWQ